ncbi:hypothetical protein IE53DRAFT_380755 [Violaceomyces palustris]|uniref:Uncharacterized protein n=1 Tax=Violaceomyces palustris TaxID=1673888 RepID=A0ACD0NTQ3_9BASI|nr:hypothetical protein IE53DRAFT_380755 [Violaceomyces palustris]
MNMEFRRSGNCSLVAWVGSPSSAPTPSTASIASSPSTTALSWPSSTTATLGLRLWNRKFLLFVAFPAARAGASSNAHRSSETG